MNLFPQSHDAWRNRTGRRYWLVAIAFAIGVAMTSTSVVFLIAADLNHTMEHLRALAEKRLHAVEDAVARSLSLVANMQTVMAAAHDGIDRRQYGAIAGDLAKRHPGMRALQWVVRVEGDERAAFEARQRKAGLADYRFTERGAGGELVPAANRDVYFPVVFTAHVADNGPVPGFDLGSEPEPRAALARARNTGDMAVTGRVRLPTETGAQWGTVVLAPVYENGIANPLPGLRESRPVGYVAGILQPNGPAPSVPADGFRFTDYIFASTEPSPETLIHAHEPVATDKAREQPGFGPAVPERAMTRTIPVADREWTVMTVSGPVSYRPGLDEWALLIAGLIGSTLIAAYLLRTIRISDRLRAEIAERRDLESRLGMASEVMERSPVMVSRWSFPRDSAIELEKLAPDYVSHNVRRLGYTAEQLTSGEVNFFDHVHPQDYAALKASLASAIRNGRSEMVDRFRFTRPDGEVCWLEGTMTLERDDEGRPVRGLGTLRDITEAKRAEAEIEFTNTALAAQMDSSPDGILVIDADDRVVSFNRRIVDFGHLSSEFLERATGDQIVEAVAPQVKDPENFRAKVAYFKAHPENPLDDEVEFKDGRIFEEHVRFLQDSQGGYLGYVVFLRDITDRKRAEKALREREATFRRLVETSPDIIWEVDENDVFTYVSPQAKAVLGYDPEELVGSTPLDLMSPAEAHRIRQTFADLRAEKQPFYQIRNTLIAKDGRELIVETSGVPIIDAGGVFRGYHGIDRDVTESVRLQQQFADRLRAALDAMPFPVSWARLSDGRIEFANHKFTETFGYTIDDLDDINSWVANCYPDPAQRKRAESQWLTFFQNPTEEESEIGPVEVDVLCKDGSVKTTLHGGMILPQAGWALATYVDITKAKAREAALARTTHDLGERVKEMSLLVEFSKRRLARADSAEPILAWLAQAMPAAWQYPDIAAARVVVDDKTYTSDNFRETEWRQHADIRTDGELRGGIDLVYLEPPPTPEEPFLPEERTLIDGLAMAASFFVERVEAEQNLRIAKRIVDNSPTILFRASLEPGLPTLFVSDNVAQYGYDAREMRESAMRLETIIHPEDLPALREAIERAIETGEPNFEIECRVRTAAGDHIWSDAKITLIRDDTGTPVMIEGVSVDVTKRREAEAEIAHMATHDALTGLPNRAVFVAETEREIARARRWGTGLAVLYLDLDNFKDTNDTRGHRFGDLLLKAVAKRLSTHLRETDTVARFGGDEFGILQTDLDDPENAALLATKLVNLVSEPFLIDGTEIRIGASVGIDVLGSDNADAETLLGHADVALYQAKEEGRRTFRFFTPAMNKEIHARVRMENELREAIASNQLFLEYQPQVEVAHGRIIGVEALVRWHHPTRGVVPPGDFIPVAERSGLIVDLGQWVLHEAARQAKEWMDAGLMVRITGINVSNIQFTAAVNVSGVQFRTRGELEKSIFKVLEETGLPPGVLELELTESSLMEVSETHGDLLTRLRRKGVRIAIDDFGTGYSSLQYLRKFPVDRIKIAQEFVIGLKADSGDAAIVKAAIGLARALGLRVIAEGVETREQLALVKKWGCPEAQGFYFSRPVAPEVIEEYLRRGGVLPQQAVRAEHTA